MALWLNGFHQSSQDKTSHPSRWPQWDTSGLLDSPCSFYFFLYLSLCIYLYLCLYLYLYLSLSSRVPLAQALTKVAWDFLLCPVQEDAAVRVKIACWIAFHGSHEAEKFWWKAAPLQERTWNTDQPILKAEQGKWSSFLSYLGNRTPRTCCLWLYYET